MPTVFAPVDDARLQEEFRAANAGAVKAMKELDAWFTQQEASATEDFALGPKKFAAMLHATYGIDVSLPRLKEIARRDLERNLVAMREACKCYRAGPNDRCVCGESARRQSFR